VDLNLNMNTTFDVDQDDAISDADERILVMRKLPETACARPLWWGRWIDDRQRER
jgi:hypothetical protein